MVSWIVESFYGDRFGLWNVGVGVFWLMIVVFAMEMLLIGTVKVFKDIIASLTFEAIRFSLPVSNESHDTSLSVVGKSAI